MAVLNPTQPAVPGNDERDGSSNMVFMEDGALRADTSLVKGASVILLMTFAPVLKQNGQQQRKLNMMCLCPMYPKQNPHKLK